MLFLFDMDNVLYDYHWRVRMHGLTDVTGWDFHELRRRWWHDEGEWKAERGDPPTGDEYLTRVNAALESDFSVDLWLHHRREAMVPRPDIIDVAACGEVSQVDHSRYIRVLSWIGAFGYEPFFISGVEFFHFSQTLVADRHNTYIASAC